MIGVRHACEVFVNKKSSERRQTSGSNRKSLNQNLRIEYVVLLRRARSSAWLERQAHNLVVEGSNPFGPTKTLFLDKGFT